MADVEDLNHLTASDEEVVDWCERWQNTAMKPGGSRSRCLGLQANIVARLNPQAIVKYGPVTTPSEAAAQFYACEVLGSARGTVIAPKVFRFFEVPSKRWALVRGKVGYLIMEYVPAILLKDLGLDDVERYSKLVADAVSLLGQQISDRPGPVDGGEATGAIFPPDSRAYEEFKSRSNFEDWFNRALKYEKKTMDLAGVDLVFCHLDLAERKVLVTDDSTVYILDWANAGFYPRFFEIWHLDPMLSDEVPLIKHLPQYLAPLTKREETLTSVLWASYRLNVRRHM